MRRTNGPGPQIDAATVSPAPLEPASRPASPTGEAGGIERVQLWPWPPVQGQAVAVWLQASDAVSATLRFNEREYHVDLAAGRGSALLPVGVLTEPADIPLVIQAAGSSVTIAVPVQDGGFPAYHVPQETGGGILNDGAKVAAETARMAQLFAVAGGKAWPVRGRFATPLDGDFPQSAPFGQRRTYGDSPTVTAHMGQDFSAMPGTPVYAPAAGTVTLAEPLYVRGNAIVLDHGGGVYTGYWHLSELGVQPGDTVSAGQLIGKVGSTGLSTGAHLHWEMRVAGVAVDPVQWVVSAAPVGQAR